MKAGYFDPENKTYVITTPETPVPWINYIGSRSFGGFVDHTGGALLCCEDPSRNRITKYIQQMPPSDFKGTTLYLRLHDESGYRIFSPYFVPTLDPLEKYECTIGPGYTRISSEYLGIRVESTIFVPLDAKCEIRDVRITNCSDRPISLDVIPLVEYSHPDALQQFTNADWVPQTMQSRVVVEEEYLILLQFPFMYRDSQVNYLTSNIPANSFETDRKEFLGRGGYGTFKDPGSLHQEQLNCSQANRGDNIGALLHALGTMDPGESRSLIIQLGQADDLEEAKETIRKYREPLHVSAAFEALNSRWEQVFRTVQVDTPDPDMNVMLNVHNPIQCCTTFKWSRYLSMYQTGLGARGIGYRDSMQDVMGALPFAAEEARGFLKTLLSFQRPDGSAVHQFNPLTLEGSAGDSMEMEDRPHYYSDDHLWGVLAALAYIKETGDYSFLDEIVPFYDDSRRTPTLEGGTVRSHLEIALQFTRQDVGRHGLPLLGFADWNDTVNLPAGAESLFTANLYGKALLEMIELLRSLREKKSVEIFTKAYNEMRTRFQDSAWDGAWFVRYFEKLGNPSGSHQNQYGQIYLNAQSWAVISGFAIPEYACTAMEAVYEYLNTDYGLRLSTPGFDGYDPVYGGVTTYPPGAKENGGIFLHPNPWAMMAETILGNGDRAYQYYAQINPVSKNNIIEVYECEPYVYAQNILGPEHPQYGLGRNSWLSGTASWCYQAAIQWILGVRPDYGGLRIDPCIPAVWESYSVDRLFRGKQYHIEVHNPEGVCRGVVRIAVDGELINGQCIPPDLNGDRQHVEVWLGVQ
ncbi:MAG: hypothetical protein JXA25_09215 [Anaerolineales bacterium]|nr:hypothetical protein [Anaerolineales bacterium]